MITPNWRRRVETAVAQNEAKIRNWTGKGRSLGTHLCTSGGKRNCCQPLFSNRRAASKSFYWSSGSSQCNQMGMKEAKVAPIATCIIIVSENVSENLPEQSTPVNPTVHSIAKIRGTGQGVKSWSPRMAKEASERASTLPKLCTSGQPSYSTTSNEQ